MKIISIDQGTKKWREWRGKGLGASIAATILEVEGAFATRFEVWCELTGLCDKAPVNEFAAAWMQRGNELEPRARALFEAEMGGRWPALCAEHDEHGFIRASPDGYSAPSLGVVPNNFGNTIIEIKCPGKDAHNAAIKAAAAGDGKLIPAKYYAQMQHQFLVTGAHKGWYVSWDGKSDKTVHVEVLPDAAYMERLKTALIQFWSLVETQIAPQPTPKDLKAIVARIEDAQKRMNQATKALTIYMESI